MQTVSSEQGQASAAPGPVVAAGASGAGEAVSEAAPVKGAAEIRSEPKEDRGRAPLSKMEQAFARAQARVAKETADAEGGPAPSEVLQTNQDNPDDKGQAAVPDAGASDSTLEAAGEAAAVGDDGQAAVPDAGASDSTLELPSNWPESVRARVAALPQGAQVAVVDVVKDFQRGFTGAMQKLSDERKSLAELSDALTTADLSPSDAAQLARSIADDPAAAVRALADRYQVDLAQPKRPESFESIDDFETYMDAKWERKIAAREAARERAKAETRAQAAYQAQLGALAKLPGFDQATVDRLVVESKGFLNPAMAYKVSQLPAMERELAQLRQQSKELAALKLAKVQAAKAAAGPVGQVRSGVAKAPAGVLSPAEAAFARAQKKVASR